MPASTFQAAREQLDVARRSERVRMVTSTLGADAVQQLGAIRLRIDDWKLKRDGWPALDRGLQRTYRRGRKAFRQLADLLGDDHDLGVLRQALLRMSPSLAADLDALLGLVDYRRAQFQTQAMSVGERLYAEKPKAFGHRMHRYWNAGRAASVVT